ncbi:hypothetical protein LPJ56_000766 [Coemansia sp. RSA 2599]|nr:hypothetical protein LPJ56_000766 [Coemansia sp. RSA 2599]
MLTLNIELDPSNAKCLVYKNRESGLRGKLHIRTSDKLKLRQISIRLVCTELVDLHDSEPSNSLHPLLRKSSKSIGTWIIWKKGDPSPLSDVDMARHAQGVLEPGDHHYSFEIPLPAGLDGTVLTKVYSLRYELETRLEYSFMLKPDSVHATPVEMVQVPMALNLHADDRISLGIVPLRLAGGPENFRVDDLPVGKSACLVPDSIDRKDSFVLHHIWGNQLSFKMRMPRGRVFPLDSKPLIDIEAVPISKEYRFTRLTLALEEITIVARPTIAGVMRQASVSASGSDNAQSAGKAKGQQQQQQQQQQQLVQSLSTRRPSTTGSIVSQMSVSSEDAHSVKASHNAWAYAKECSSEYLNSITKVRVLSHLQHALASQKQQQQNLHQGSVAAFHGILVSKVHLGVPHPENNKSCADIRNSHIQIHHQLVYELEYQRLDVAELNEANAAFSAASADARIKAVAHVYKALTNANIVRRDELKGAGAANAGSDRSGTVRGTLPVAIVARRISDLWGIRNLSQDTLSHPSTVVAALMDVEQPAFYPPNASSSSAVSGSSGPALLSFPVPPSTSVTAGTSSLHARRPGSVASFGTCSSGTATAAAAVSNNGHQRGQSAADASAALVRNPGTSASSQQPLAPLSNRQSKSSLQHQDSEAILHSPSQNTPYPPPSATTTATHHGGYQMSMPEIPMAMPQATYPYPANPHSPPALGFSMAGMGSSHQYPPYPQHHNMAAPAVSSAYPVSTSTSTFHPYPPPLSASSTGTDSGAVPSHAAHSLAESVPATPASGIPAAVSAGVSQPMASFGGMAFNPMMFQEQMRLFQEQQRQQQEQFFKQLSEQYAQMMMSPGSQQHPPPVSSPTFVASSLASSAGAPVTSQQSATELSCVPAQPEVRVTADASESAETSGVAAPAAAQPTTAESTDHRPPPVRNSASVQSAHSTYELASDTLAVEPDGASAAASLNGRHSFVSEGQPSLRSQSSAELSSASGPAAIAQREGEATALPPSYDDIMPPDYEIPAQQPPPYQPVDTTNTGRRNQTRR